MNRVKDFFLFCSGVDRSMLAQVPSDENKYLGIGGTIFFTGVLAFFSSAYALYYIFDSTIAAIAFGIVWGLMIFNLDRYIVSSMKSKGGFFGNLATATPRLLMAVLLALVISKPLELKIFEKEINAELIVMEQEVYKEQEDRIQARYTGQIAGFETDNERLRAEIDAAVVARDAKVAAALAEADGSGGSQIRNMGPIYRAKRAEADQAAAELTAIQTENEPLIAANRTAIAALQNEIATEIDNLQRGAYGGIAARIDALDRLGAESHAIYLASLFIMLLFIAVETAPIFTKLISSRSPYDHLLNEHEHVFAMAAKESMTERSNDVKNRLRVHGEVGIYRAKSEIATKKAEIDIEMQERLQRLRGYGLG